MKQLLYISGLIALLFFSGCCHKVEFVLLPEEDGSVGKIIIVQGSKEVLLDKPYQKVSTTNLYKKELTSKESVEAEFGTLLDAMPKEVKNYRFSFKSASADTVGDATKMIDEIVEYIKSNDVFQVDVIGYTDTVGDNASNETLSLLRAKTIVDMLKAKGVDENIISLEYYGEANQIVKTADEVSNKENRRVEVTIK